MPTGQSHGLLQGKDSDSGELCVVHFHAPRVSGVSPLGGAGQDAGEPRSPCALSSVRRLLTRKYRLRTMGLPTWQGNRLRRRSHHDVSH